MLASTSFICKSESVAFVANCQMMPKQFLLASAFIWHKIRSLRMVSASKLGFTVALLQIVAIRLNDRSFYQVRSSCMETSSNRDTTGCSSTGMDPKVLMPVVHFRLLHPSARCMFGK